MRDFYFFVVNKVFGYTLQLVVELNSLNKESDQLGPNSFLSADGRFIYHFGLSDYLQTQRDFLCING